MPPMPYSSRYLTESPCTFHQSLWLKSASNCCRLRVEKGVCRASFENRCTDEHILLKLHLITRSLKFYNNLSMSCLTFTNGEASQLNFDIRDDFRHTVQIYRSQKTRQNLGSKYKVLKVSLIDTISVSKFIV